MTLQVWSLVAPWIGLHELQSGAKRKWGHHRPDLEPLFLIQQCKNTHFSAESFHPRISPHFLRSQHSCTVYQVHDF
eukprot:g79610.t1